MTARGCRGPTVCQSTGFAGGTVGGIARGDRTAPAGPGHAPGPDGPANTGGDGTPGPAGPARRTPSGGALPGTDGSIEQRVDIRLRTGSIAAGAVDHPVQHHQIALKGRARFGDEPGQVLAPLDPALQLVDR